MPGRLQDRVAVITGAASGIGRATALLFAAEGARVVVADRDERGGQETADRIISQEGLAIFVPADVTSPGDVDRMLGRAVETFGGIDVLFNNAGRPMSLAPIETVTGELLDDLIDINIKGVFYGCQRVAPLLKERGGGVILNTASTAGIRPRPGLSAYAMTKAAVIGLTKALALELAPHKIRVVAICPVATDTPMLPRFVEGRELAEGRQLFLESIPLGRLATADDIAQAALWLASDAASMVTGTSFEVDGGRDV